jgi:hypothetical protein
LLSRAQAAWCGTHKAQRPTAMGPTQSNILTGWIDELEPMRRATLAWNRSVLAHTLSHFFLDLASSLSSMRSMNFSIPSLPDIFRTAAPGLRAAHHALWRGERSRAPRAVANAVCAAATAPRGGTPGGAALRSSPPAGDSSSATHTAGNRPLLAMPLSGMLAWLEPRATQLLLPPVLQKQMASLANTHELPARIVNVTASLPFCN